MDRTCSNCKNWSPGFSKWSALECPEGFGECRAKAPIGPWNYGTMPSEAGPFSTSLMSAFPMVASDDWCGEHKGADNEQHR